MKNNLAKSKKILVIEDEEKMLNLLEERFKQEKWIVFRAENGKEGLETALRERPDLIVLDILLPKFGGLKMLEKLRKNKWGSRVSVIILTNLSSVHSVSMALSNGVYDFLIKTDWKLEDVVEKIKQRLGHR